MSWAASEEMFFQRAGWATGSGRKKRSFYSAAGIYPLPLRLRVLFARRQQA